MTGPTPPTDPGSTRTGHGAPAPGPAAQVTAGLVPTVDLDDDADAAAMDAMIEEILGRVPRPITWAALSAAQAGEVWLALDEWVRWLVTRYALDHRDVPACWYAHGDLVEELTALMTAHQGAYDRAGPATGPADWHQVLANTRTRLQAWAGRTGCRHGQHRDPTPPAWAGEPAPTEYGEAFLAHVETDTKHRADP